MHGDSIRIIQTHLSFPCQGCIERVLGCHDKCEIYQNVKIQNAELNKLRSAEKEKQNLQHVKTSKTEELFKHGRYKQT